MAFDKSEYVHRVFSRISDSYDLMNDLESLGLHRVWKKRLVQELSATQPKRVLDVACGTGDIALALAKKNPQAKVFGLDFNADMLSLARTRLARELPLSFVLPIHPVEAIKDQERVSPFPLARSNNKLNFIEGNALALPFEDESIDAVSISFGLRNMSNYAAVLAEIYRVLKPGGHFYCLEASYPTNKLVRPPFKFYFKYWLPVLGKLIVNSPDEYSWLNTSTEAFLSKDALALLMRKLGFKKVSYSSYLLGAVALHRGSKAP